LLPLVSSHWFWNEEGIFPLNGKFQQFLSLLGIALYLRLQGTSEKPPYLRGQVGNAGELDDFGKRGVVHGASFPISNFWLPGISL
jgi:hypothetical protein